MTPKERAKNYMRLKKGYKDSTIEKELSVGFDFDGCLSEKPMQLIAKKLIAHGVNVHIVTSRATEMYGGQKLQNDDLFQLADFLGIKRENITFTNFEDKYLYVKDFDIFFDNDENEIGLINDFPLGKVLGFLFEPNLRREQKQANF